MNISQACPATDLALSVRQEPLLIRRIVEGEAQLMPELLAPYERQLLQQAGRFLRCPADIEDALQETRWKALVHLGTFRAEATFQTWLISLLFNECRMILRRRKRRSFVPFEEGAGNVPLQESPAPLQRLCRLEAENEIRRRVSALPPLYRGVIEQRFFQEKTLEETSFTLSLTLSAVKSRQYRALALLRRYTANAAGTAGCSAVAKNVYGEQ